MRDRIELLDTVIDVASTNTVCKSVKQYLSREGSSVLYFLNSETLLLLQNNQEYREVLGSCEWVLPGNQNVNASVDEVAGSDRDVFVFESFFESILDHAIEKGYEFFLLAEDSERFNYMKENIHEKRPYLTLSGMFLTDKEESLDHVVNEINSMAPDILLVALDEKKQWEMIKQFRNQINAGLMLFTGNILYNKVVAEAEVPEPIQKLRIANLYKWLRIEGIKQTLNNLKMKIVIKRHHKDNK